MKIMIGPSHHFLRTRMNAHNSPKILRREKNVWRNFNLDSLDYDDFSD